MILAENKIQSGVSNSSLNIDSIPKVLSKSFTDLQIHSVFEMLNNDADQFGIKRGCVVFINQKIEPLGGMLLMILQKEKYIIRQLLTLGSKQFLTTGKEKDKPVPLNEADVVGVVTWCCSAKVDFEFMKVSS
nr:hypothetical protein [uncultured Pedobacter sp.]